MKCSKYHVRCIVLLMINCPQTKFSFYIRRSSFTIFPALDKLSLSLKNVTLRRLDKELILSNKDDLPVYLNDMANDTYQGTVKKNGKFNTSKLTFSLTCS